MNIKEQAMEYFVKRAQYEEEQEDGGRKKKKKEESHLSKYWPYYLAGLAGLGGGAAAAYNYGPEIGKYTGDKWGQIKKWLLGDLPTSPSAEEQKKYKTYTEENNNNNNYSINQLAKAIANNDNMIRENGYNVSEKDVDSVISGKEIKRLIKSIAKGTYGNSQAIPTAMPYDDPPRLDGSTTKDDPPGWKN